MNLYEGLSLAVLLGLVPGAFLVLGFKCLGAKADEGLSTFISIFLVIKTDFQTWLEVSLGSHLTEISLLAAATDF